ncbi:MAG: DUF2098 domain-containing protein [Candidatus Methanomethyliaceae archaeon]|nr:DUF2098 domain-containing protein [Candidatus Methanomethyliaceae archaeon]
MKIKEGSMVIYRRTGTIGRIIEFKNMDGKLWARLDTTNLLYDADFLEVIESKQLSAHNQQKVEHKIERKAEREEQIRDEETIDSSAGVCGAG